MNTPIRYSPEELPELCRQVRRDILRMVTAVNSGHPGGSLGCTELLAVLYTQLMHHWPEPWDMTGNGQDVFILSNGHISPVLYSLLARTGYFPVAELATFRKINSRLQGHPATHEGLPGVRIATGSLGQGLSVAIGLALGKRLAADPRRVFCLTGDGEVNEGQIWEAAMFAAHHAVDNLIAIVDWNGKQIDGDVRDVMNTGDLELKFRAFGWATVLLERGNDLQAVQQALHEALELTLHGKPVAVLMKSIMGHGVDYMADDYRWHGKAPNAQQLEQALAQLPLTRYGDYS